MRNKIIIGCVISGIIFCISYICFAGEKEELLIKQNLYNEMLRSAQLQIYYAENELIITQNRLQKIAQEEANKPEIKKEEMKK